MCLVFRCSRARISFLTEAVGRVKVLCGVRVLKGGNRRISRQPSPRSLPTQKKLLQHASTEYAVLSTDLSVEDAQALSQTHTSTAVGRLRRQSMPSHSS